MGVQMYWLVYWLAMFKLFLGHCGVCAEKKNDCSHSSFVFRLHPLPVRAAPCVVLVMLIAGFLPSM